MSLIEEEKKRLLEYLKRQDSQSSGMLFLKAQQSSTCYISKEDAKEDIIRDYAFESPVEFINLLEELWAENSQELSELLPIIAAAVFKQKPQLGENAEIGEEQGRDCLEVPMFIYNF